MKASERFKGVELAESETKRLTAACMNQGFGTLPFDAVDIIRLVITRRAFLAGYINDNVKGKPS